MAVYMDSMNNDETIIAKPNKVGSHLFKFLSFLFLTCQLYNDIKFSSRYIHEYFNGSECTDIIADTITDTNFIIQLR
jgi:hypothetical protein